jgi:hypothetical protein
LEVIKPIIILKKTLKPFKEKTLNNSLAPIFLKNIITCKLTITVVQTLPKSTHLFYKSS